MIADLESKVQELEQTVNQQSQNLKQTENFNKVTLIKMLSQETVLSEKEDFINDLRKSLKEAMQDQSQGVTSLFSDKKSLSIYENNNLHNKQISILKSELDTVKSLIEVENEHKKHLDESFLKILEKKVEKIDEQYSNTNLNEKQSGQQSGQDAQDSIDEEKIINENMLISSVEDQGLATSEYNFNILDQDLGSNHKFSGYDYKNFETASNFENDRNVQNNKLFLFESFECCFDEIKKILEEKSTIISSMMFEKREQEKIFNKERTDFLNSESSFKNEIETLKKILEDRENDLKYFESVINSDDSSTEKLTELSGYDNNTLLNLVNKERNEKKILLKRLSELKETNLDMAKQ